MVYNHVHIVKSLLLGILLKITITWSTLCLRNATSCNGTAQNKTDLFWWYLAEIFKRL